MISKIVHIFLQYWWLATTIALTNEFLFIYYFFGGGEFTFSDIQQCNLRWRQLHSKVAGAC